MKKQILAGLMAASTILMAGCAGDSGSDATSTDSASTAYGNCEVTGQKGEFSLETLTPGQLTVKADLPSKGWYNGDTVDQIKDGLDFCILANIAYRAGIDKIDLQNASFDGLIAGKAGDMDLTLNQITITDERKQIFDFSDPYYSSAAGVVVKKGSTVTADSLKNAKIGVKQGTTEQLFVNEKLKPTQEVAVYPGDPELDAAVAAGQIDAAVQDLGVALGYTSASNGALQVAGQYDSGESLGVLLPKDSPNTAVVSQIINQMKQDGTIEKLASKYLGEAYSMDPTQVPAWSL